MHMDMDTMLRPEPGRCQLNGYQKRKEKAC